MGMGRVVQAGRDRVEETEARLCRILKAWQSREISAVLSHLGYNGRDVSGSCTHLDTE